jgi:hypothetical protein
MLSCRNMTARFFKTFAATFLSLTLAYYGVAWAALQCFHEEDDLYKSAVSDVGNRPIYHDVALDHSSPTLECPCPACVIESVADSSSQSRAINLTGEIRLNLGDSSAMRSTAGDEKRVLWRRSVFDTSPNAVPRYLSVSILRI